MTKSQSNDDIKKSKQKDQITVTLNLDLFVLDQLTKLADRLRASVDDFSSDLVTLALGEIDKTVFISNAAQRYELESARKVLRYHRSIRQIELKILHLLETISAMEQSIDVKKYCGGDSEEL